MTHEALRLADALDNVDNLGTYNSELLEKAAAMLRRVPELEPPPKEPPPGLLMSMAIRFDHGLGIPGYYDSAPFRRPGQPGHQQRLDATLSTMRQLYEEVSGHGFYKPEKEALYAAMKGST